MSEPLFDSHKFKLWEKNLKTNGLDVHGYEHLYTRSFDGQVLFGLVLLNATTPEGNKIPPICFIKGQVVSVLICLIDQDTKERFLLLVHQRRICNGALIYEHVAGLVDGDDDPHAVAVREAQEEAGIELRPEQVIRLNEEPFYPSTGTSDEAMLLYYCEIEMGREEIMSYDAQETGLAHENEQIRTKITTIPEALKLITNPNGLLNIYMYLEAKGEIGVN